MNTPNSAAAETILNKHAPLATRRLGSLDQFRGYAVAVMFVVNFCRGLAEVPNWIKHHDTLPKLFFVQSSTEYWSRAGSLLHTDVEGQRDIELDPNTRIYLIAGAQHLGQPQRTEQSVATCVTHSNTVGQYCALH